MPEESKLTAYRENCYTEGRRKQKTNTGEGKQAQVQSKREM